MDLGFMDNKDVASTFGVTVATLKNWEKKGYLIPEITLPNGRKRYTRQQIESCIKPKGKGEKSDIRRGSKN